MSFAPCLVPCLKTEMDPASKRRVNRVFKKSLSVCRFCAALSTQIVSCCLMFSRLVCLFVSSSVSVLGQRFSSVSEPVLTIV